MPCCLDFLEENVKGQMLNAVSGISRDSRGKPFNNRFTLSQDYLVHPGINTNYISRLRQMLHLRTRLEHSIANARNKD